jgi:hypothetical protein
MNRIKNQGVLTIGGRTRVACIGTTDLSTIDGGIFKVELAGGRALY